MILNNGRAKVGDSITEDRKGYQFVYTVVKSDDEGVKAVTSSRLIEANLNHEGYKINSRSNY